VFVVGRKVVARAVGHKFPVYGDWVIYRAATEGKEGALGVGGGGGGGGGGVGGGGGGGGWEGDRKDGWGGSSRLMRWWSMYEQDAVACLLDYD